MRWIASCAAAFGVVLPSPAHADFTVNDAGDQADANLADADCDVSGTAGIQCTLRAAIEEANETAGTDVISFAFPPSGVTTIAPASAYPDLTSPITINGYSQPGASPNTQPFGKPLDTVLRVMIDGSLLPNDFNSETLDFESGSAGSAVRGLVLSGNPNTAIRSGIGASFAVQGNFIGTNSAGTEAFANAGGFFGFSGSAIIGGDDPADTNLISGNTHSAIGTNAGVSVERNYIGVAADAKTPLPTGDPNNIFSQAVGFYGTPNRLVQNIIAHNPVPGVVMFNDGTVTYSSENRIFANEGPAFDIQDDGVTPNDPLDADTSGPNDLQNFPVVKRAKARTSTTKIRATLRSMPSGNYQVELFETKQKRRESRRFLGTFPVTTDAEGIGKLNAEVGRRVKPGRFVTATAIDLALGTEGGTSEFSKPRKVK
jgi:hypothetical protein